MRQDRVDHPLTTSRYGLAMACYIRPQRPGATIFFTVALARCGGDLLVDQVQLLRDAVSQTRRARPFGIDAWVVLPDHLHAIWTLPEGDADFSTRWGAIKARFSRAVRSQGIGAVGSKPTLQGSRRVGFQPTDVAGMRCARSGSKVAKGDAGIWQRRFWEHHIRDTADYEAHMRYCWLNPVKHGLAERPVDWPYSSVHRDIREGRIEADWSGAIPEGRFGEFA